MSEDIDRQADAAKELFQFLQGNIPEGTFVSKSHRPKLTPDQAWTVIWFIGNQYCDISDAIERCDVCGEIYHSWREGHCLDFGKKPYYFCENCMEYDEFAKKQRSKLNPDRKEARGESK